jgi:hypothetical protein
MGIKSEGERTGIKRRNGGYNQREAEGPHKQKQKMKRKNFKKGESEMKQVRQKNIRIKVGNGFNVGGSRIGWYSCRERRTEIKDVQNTECRLKLMRKVISLSSVLE